MSDMTSTLFPIPKTEAEKREILRAGSVAIERIYSALQEIDGNGIETEQEHGEYNPDILLDDALENSRLLFYLICHYLPDMISVNVNVRGDEEGRPFTDAYRKIREEYRAGRFSG